ncbi:hypothetical protein DSO57_1016687 [Entomophthora muscae]|uniref:Uncharacterized protein n=1 Tax=Entomophthora muscae TaxID=34485 RepID=A0ACC2RJI9_9FUNG|nr:hypothetical protein DSO57_1016687 [Entomophthora muscae]
MVLWSFLSGIFLTNQIITGGQVWKRKEVFPVKEAKFNEDFLPLIGGNKNQTKEETEFNSCQNNLTSGQAPTTPASTLRQPPVAQPAASRPPANPLLACQPPTAQPATCQPTCFLPGSQLAASHPPRSQAPTHSQSESTITCSQSEKSMDAGKIFQKKAYHPEEGGNRVPEFKNYSCPTEEIQAQVLHVSNNSSHDQWVAASQVTRLSLGSNQIMCPKTEIDSKGTLSFSNHMTSCPQEPTGLSQELPN